MSNPPRIERNPFDSPFTREMMPPFMRERIQQESPHYRSPFDLGESVRLISSEQKEPEKPKKTVVKWSDVIGCDEAKQSLIEAIEAPIKHKKIYKCPSFTPWELKLL